MLVAAAAAAQPRRRLYRKKATQSTQFTSTVRVYNQHQHRVVYEGARPKNARQATNGPKGKPGVVYAYVPPPLDGTFKCCNGECFREYQDPADSRVQRAREPLFDKRIQTTDKATLRDALKAQWDTTLLMPDGYPVCLIMACRIFGCSKTKLYPDKRSRNAGAPLAKPCVIAESIGSWFVEIKSVADVMPDEGWYQLNEPLRSMVYNNYVLDCADSPELYTKCSPDYFNKMWRENYPEVRLRKTCRFAKCSFCVHWRGVYERNDHRRPEAKTRLRAHRDWASIRERAEWKHKRNQAIQDPSRYISISMDGTDKVRLFLPHSSFIIPRSHHTHTSTSNASTPHNSKYQ